MSCIPNLSSYCLSGFLLLIIGTATFGGKLKPSDPHLTGPRDMDYDHLIVPGIRVGPVALRGKVGDAVRHLGNPDHVNRTSYSGRADRVYYYYKDDCVGFSWDDVGLDPTIVGGISVMCDKWRTSSGIHVGSAPQDAIKTIPEYCTAKIDDGHVVIETKIGIWFRTKNRYSPIYAIEVYPVETKWTICRDEGP